MPKMDIPELEAVLLRGDDVITSSDCTGADTGCAPDFGCGDYTDIGCTNLIQPGCPENSFCANDNACPGDSQCGSNSCFHDCPANCVIVVPDEHM